MTIRDMKKRAKWLRPLNAAEIRHLEETTCEPGGFPTLRNFKANREGHLVEVRLGNPDPCYLCRLIARKLGMSEVQP